MSKLVEAYVCKRLGLNKNGTPFTNLNEFYKYLLFQAENLEDTNETNKIRLAVHMLRNFVHYLTFYSWGNPKRLASIFEGFMISTENLDRKKIIFIEASGNKKLTKLAFPPTEPKP